MDYHILLFLLGRLIYGGYFFMQGVNHYRMTEGLAGYAASKGVSSPKLAVLGSGLLLFIGGLGIIGGVYVEWAVLALALFLVPVSLRMHAFWKETGMEKMSDMINFTKNMALLGGALMFLAIPQPWPYTAF
jgi:uncharacterized membrane protein YphA (DoxX/SURF4 family)